MFEAAVIFHCTDDQIYAGRGTTDSILSGEMLSKRTTPIMSLSK